VLKTPTKTRRKTQKRPQIACRVTRFAGCCCYCLPIHCNPKKIQNKNKKKNQIKIKKQKEYILNIFVQLISAFKIS